MMNYERPIDVIRIERKVNKSRNISLEVKEVYEKMVFEMELRGFSKGTQYDYLLCIKKFIEFNKLHTNLQKLSLDDVKSFLIHLKKDINLKAKSINVYRASIKFLFVKLLECSWDDNKVPAMKISATVPVVLSKEEVLRFLNSMNDFKYRSIAILMYSAGLRVSEAAKLKISDIDSKNMQIFINNGKGNKDRYAILSDECLQFLRKYYRIYRPANYLFEGVRTKSHISIKSIQWYIKKIAIKSGFTKKITAHTFRHCFACHLLERDTNIYYIKQLLGHASLASSSQYLKAINYSNINVKSPFDTIGDKL